MKQVIFALMIILGSAAAYTPQTASRNPPTFSQSNSNRRGFFKIVGAAGAAAVVTAAPNKAEAIGPVKLKLKVNSYSAKICPPDRPIPGEKAMKGMKGLCVTVNADVQDVSPKASIMLNV